MSVLSSLEPKKVFEFFEYLSSVPHGSGNTKQISDLCVRFARERGLRYLQDDVNNVIIYKAATPGYENDPTVILQGHMDMVCAKYPEDPVDMSREPIKLRTDGEWVWADRTSLGGDDCIAVAAALAILDDNTLEHPALECIFTVDEETGMDGVIGIDPDAIHGRLMLNLDSEADGVFTVGCAGGAHVDCEYPVVREPLKNGEKVCMLAVSGLLGGHSGCEIDKERGNAILLSARILCELRKVTDVRLVSIYAGQFTNVIPSKCGSIFAFPAKDEAAVAEKFGKTVSEIRAELAVSDPGFSAGLADAYADFDPVSSEVSGRFLSMLASLPNGVQNMSMDFEGLVQTSLSMGVIRTFEKRITFPESVRSSLASQRDFVAEKAANIVKAFGGKAEITGSYPGWAYRRDSALREKLVSVYRDYTGSEPVIFATHGGLECGLFIDKLPGLDAISIGPDLRDIHSVNEKMNVKSVGKLYGLIREFLRRH